MKEKLANTYIGKFLFLCGVKIIGSILIRHFYFLLDESNALVEPRVDSKWTSEENTRFDDVTTSKRLTGTFASQSEEDKFPVRLVEDCGSVRDRLYHIADFESSN